MQLARLNLLILLFSLINFSPIFADPEPSTSPSITPSPLNSPSPFISPSPLVSLAPGQWPPNVGVDHWDQDWVYFKAPEGYSAPAPLKTELKGIQIIGLLTPATSNIPYLLMSADGHKTQNLYLIRGDNGSRSTFPFPGRVWDKKTGQTLLKSRAFFGTCIHDRSVVYVAFQEETIDRKRRRSRIEKSVFVGEITERGLEEKLMTQRLPGIQNVLHRVKKGLCTEVQGKERPSIDFDLSLPYQSGDTEEVENTVK